MSKPAVIVAGIDVGGKKKGMHAVSLSDGVYHSKFPLNGSASPTDVAKWCREQGAQVIAIDAPCSWSQDGRARPCERELMAEEIFCYSTPEKDAAKKHLKKNFHWMLNGMDLYAELAATHPLLGEFPPARPYFTFETFPHAVTCAASGKIASAKTKRTDRRQILCNQGICTDELTNIDWIDAALCAWVAHLVTRKPLECKPYGDAKGGYIVAPQRFATP